MLPLKPQTAVCLKRSFLKLLEFTGRFGDYIASEITSEVDRFHWHNPSRSAPIRCSSSNHYISMNHRHSSFVVRRCYHHLQYNFCDCEKLLKLTFQTHAWGFRGAPKSPNYRVSTLRTILFGVGCSQKYYGHHDDMNRDHESKQSFSNKDMLYLRGVEREREITIILA